MSDETMPNSAGTEPAAAAEPPVNPPPDPTAGPPAPPDPMPASAGDDSAAIPAAAQDEAPTDAGNTGESDAPGAATTPVAAPPPPVAAAGDPSAAPASGRSNSLTLDQNELDALLAENGVAVPPAKQDSSTPGSNAVHPDELQALLAQAGMQDIASAGAAPQPRGSAEDDIAAAMAAAIAAESQAPIAGHEPQAVGNAAVLNSPVAASADQAVRFQPGELMPVCATDGSDIDMLDDVQLDVKIELGRTDMYIEDVLRLGVGSVVELDKLAGDPVDIFVNDRLIARGEVLVLNDNFCVRINHIISPVPELDVA